MIHFSIRARELGPSWPPASRVILLLLGIVGVVAIMFAAATGNSALISSRLRFRLGDLQRGLRVCVGRPRTTLPNGGRRLFRCRHGFLTDPVDSPDGSC